MVHDLIPCDPIGKPLYYSSWWIVGILQCCFVNDWFIVVVLCHSFLTNRSNIFLINSTNKWQTVTWGYNNVGQLQSLQPSVELSLLIEMMATTMIKQLYLQRSLLAKYIVWVKTQLTCMSSREWEAYYCTNKACSWLHASHLANPCQSWWCKRDWMISNSGRRTKK